MRSATLLPVAIAAALALLPAPLAQADEALARRLSALKALVDPASVREARPEVTPETPLSCGGGTWWRVTDYGVQARIDAAVRHASIRYAVDQRLIRAVITTESNYQVDAVSHKGAQGLM